jgi:hypothetical protein
VGSVKKLAWRVVNVAKTNYLKKTLDNQLFVWYDSVVSRGSGKVWQRGSNVLLLN